jgi:putative hydrolase of the HAD superfamily
MCCRPDSYSSAECRIDAILFDLDDTLYPQAAWLDGAWEAVAAAGARLGIPKARFYHELVAIAAEGSDRGRVIDRALERISRPSVPVPPLVEAFRRYEPASLLPYPGVRESLAYLSSRLPIGVVSDGDPDIQRSKLRALRFQNAFDVVVMSDELGRSHRKPHPAPLIRAAKTLRVEPVRCVYVGDRPEKDVAAARAARMRAVRVRTGEYAWAPDVPVPWHTARDLRGAIDRLRPFFQGAKRR